MGKIMLISVDINPAGSLIMNYNSKTCFRRAEGEMPMKRWVSASAPHSPHDLPAAGRRRRVVAPH
jgi:hypothetical protein